jgi:hypothetical protein
MTETTEAQTNYTSQYTVRKILKVLIQEIRDYIKLKLQEQSLYSKEETGRKVNRTWALGVSIHAFKKHYR